MSQRQVTKEQIELARQASLAEYFQRKGYDCELSRKELHVKGFGGLNINVETNSWYCFSQSKGSKNPIDCLTEIFGMDFKEAVVELSGGSYTYSEDYKPFKPSFTAQKSTNELVLPEKADNMKRVYAYLCNTRKIAPEMVSKLAHEGLLYQDVKGNAVFLHKKDGKIVGAEIQGTSTYKRYKGVATGTSNSVFSVMYGVPEKCYVFESAIDLISFSQIATDEVLRNSVLVSMAGLKPSAILPYKEKGLKILSCVDNDEAGMNFTETNGLCSYRDMLVSEEVKDWNDLLKKRAEMPSDPVEPDISPVKPEIEEKEDGWKKAKADLAEILAKSDLFKKQDEIPSDPVEPDICSDKSEVEGQEVDSWKKAKADLADILSKYDIPSAKNQRNHSKSHEIDR
jgi:hypothetical protein